MRPLFTVKSCTKIVLLILANLLFCAFSLPILLFMSMVTTTIFSWLFTATDVLENMIFCVIVIVAVLILILLAMLLVDNIKLWLINLPIQTGLLILVQSINSGVQFADNKIYRLLYAILIIAIQSVGVLINEARKKRKQKGD